MENNYKMTVDIGRIFAAKKLFDSDIGVEATFREAYQNSINYNGTDMLFFHIKYNLKEYLICVHNGKPFNNKREMRLALHFNVTGGNGMQGSGMKASKYTINNNVLNSELILWSRTKNDGDISLRLFHETDTELNWDERSNEWNKILMTLLGDKYDNYNVGYIYRCNNIKMNKHEKIITSTKRMYSFYSIIDIKDNVTIKYCPDKLYDHTDTIDFAHVATLNKNYYELYKSKTFYLKSNKVEIPLESEDGKNIIHADVTVDVYPQFMSTDTNISHSNLIYDCNGSTNSNGKITNNTLSKTTLLVYHDYKFPSDKTKRSNNEPCYITNKTSAKHLALELGIDYPFDKIPATQVQDELNDYFSFKHNFDYSKYVVEPLIIIKVYLKNIKNVFDLIGGVDNLFFSNNTSRLRDILKTIFNNIYENNSKELIECKKYISKFTVIRDDDEPTPIMRNTKGSSVNEISAICTKEAFDILKTYVDLKKQPKKIGDVIPYIPVNLNIGIPVKLWDVINEEYITTDNIICDNEGLIIKKHPINIDEYMVYTLPYSHKKNGSIVKLDSIENLSFGRNYLPKRYSKFIINGIERNTSLKVDTAQKFQYEIDRSSPKKAGKKETLDVYDTWNDQPKLLVKYINKTTKLNLANKIIYKLTHNNDEKDKNTLTNIYNIIHKLALSIYYDIDNNIVDSTKMNINVDKTLESFNCSSEKELILNYTVAHFLNNNPDSIKLINKNIKKTSKIMDLIKNGI